MKEYFIVTQSFAAPFFSDTDQQYVKAKTPKEAVLKVAANYSHPCGLYAAIAYSSSDAKNKGEKPLAKWLCNHEIEKDRLTKNLGAYSYLGYGVGDFEINGVRHHVENPRSGRIVT